MFTCSHLNIFIASLPGYINHLQISNLKSQISCYARYTRQPTKNQPINPATKSSTKPQFQSHMNQLCFSAKSPYLSHRIASHRITSHPILFCPVLFQFHIVPLHSPCSLPVRVWHAVTKDSNRIIPCLFQRLFIGVWLFGCFRVVVKE
jgi:hypothetical protein